MIRKLLAATTAALVTGCATPGSGTSVSIPEKLGAAPGETLALETHATGVQIYECAAVKEDPARFEWAFKTPEADLFDRSGNKVGKHYGGPTWESKSGSKVVGAVVFPRVTVDPDAIPWLLLSALQAEGPGIFAHTSYIHRINTVEGKAPATAGAFVGQVVRVPYAADYFFYRKANH